MFLSQDDCPLAAGGEFLTLERDLAGGGLADPEAGAQVEGALATHPAHAYSQGVLLKNELESEYRVCTLYMHFVGNFLSYISY